MTGEVEPARVRQQLGRVLASPWFRRAERSSTLLTFLVERVLAGEGDTLKEYTLGAEALGRGADFDPRTDTIVRAEASRLRTRLDRYYETDGRGDPVVIVLPKGSYAPEFSVRDAAEPTAPADQPADLSTRTTPPRITALRWGTAGFALAAALFGAVAWMRPGREGHADTPVVRFEVELASDGILGSHVGTDVVLSPDGTRVVFVARDATGLAHVYTRRLDERAARRLPATDGARSVFVSPDGRWVGFWADGQIRKVPAGGGDPVSLCEAGDLLGASWGERGTIVAAFGDGRLRIVPESGGTPEVLVDLSTRGGSPVWPHLVPDSDLVLFTALAGDADRATVEVISLTDRTRTTLVRGGTFGRVVGNDVLTYVNQGTLYALPFDSAARRVSGTPVPVLSDVSYSSTFGYAQLDVSRTGTLVYRRAAESELRTVAWLDTAGRTTPLLSKPARYAWPRVSPDGQRLALSVTEAGATRIWIHDTRTGDVRRIQTGAADHTGLLWWPDGSRLLYGGLAGMASIAIEAGGDPQPLTRDRALALPWSIAPGASRLAYHMMSPSTAFDLWTAPIRLADGRLQLGSPERFLQTPAMETMPAFSPDGRWMAYASNASGVPTVYVRAFPAGGEPVRVSTGGGNSPKWSPVANELLYRTLDRRVMAVTYAIENGTFVVGASRWWTSQVLADTGVLPGFDLAPDGERIAALLPVPAGADRQAPNHATFVLHFADEVRQRVTR